MMELFVVYKQPSDYPDSYVTRRQVLRDDGSLWVDRHPCAVASVTMGETALEAVRLPPMSKGLVQMPPMPGDDPCILEMWL